MKQTQRRAIKFEFMLTGENNRWQKHLVNFFVNLKENFPMENNLFELSKVMIMN